MQLKMGWNCKKYDFPKSAHTRSNILIKRQMNQYGNFGCTELVSDCYLNHEYIVYDYCKFVIVYTRFKHKTLLKLDLK
jgi:hypothetical protein